jgi:hypothetical protein
VPNGERSMVQQGFIRLCDNLRSVSTDGLSLSEFRACEITTLEQVSLRVGHICFLRPPHPALLKPNWKAAPLSAVDRFIGYDFTLYLTPRGVITPRTVRVVLPDRNAPIDGWRKHIPFLRMMGAKHPSKDCQRMTRMHDFSNCISKRHWRSGA